MVLRARTGRLMHLLAACDRCSDRSEYESATLRRLREKEERERVSRITLSCKGRLVLSHMQLRCPVLVSIGKTRL